MAEISAQFDQDGFRFRNDDGSEAAATWKANLNTNATVIIGQTFRLRFLVQETAGGTNAEGFKLQSNLNGAGWNDVTASSTVAKIVASTGLTEGGDTTQQLGAGTFQTDNDGQEDGDGTTTNTAETKASKDIELEFAVQLLDADVDDTDEVQFRVVKSGGGALDTYTRTPTATAQAAVTTTITPDTWPLEAATQIPVIVLGLNPASLAITITTYAPSLIGPTGGSQSGMMMTGVG